MTPLKYEAFFITPENFLVPVKRNHIDVICDHPEIFGFTIDHVKDIFHKYDEPLKSELQARKELLKEIFEKGFIRLRFKTKEDSYWEIELLSLDCEKQKEQISAWAKKMISDKSFGADENMPVRVIENGKCLNELGNLTLLELSKLKSIVELKILDIQ
jgi:CRISPR/Cas system CMR-associated protein Cmr5 small subunit